MKKEIKCFIFDFNGVLFHNSDVVRRMLEKEGFAKEPLDALSGTGRIGSLYVIGKISYQEYLHEAQKLFPHDYIYITQMLIEGKGLLYIDAAWFKKEVVDTYGINFDFDVFTSTQITMLDVLSELCNQYALCLFSGNSKQQLAVLDEKYSFMKYFIYTVFSFDVGVDKPDKKMFDRLVQTLPYSPDECIYFDDHIENITVGNTYGFHSILLPFESLYIQQI